MYQHFTEEFFVGNRQRLRQLFTGKAPIVMTANGQLQRYGEVTYPFHQDPSFWYLTGVNDPDVVLVMDKDKEYLIVPDYEPSKQIFDGAIDQNELQKISGIKTLYSEDEGWKVLSKRLKKSKHVATVNAAPAYVGGHFRFYTNPARAELLERLKSYNKELELLDLRPHLVKMRCIKQAPEIAAIKDAISVTSKAVKQLHRRKYKFEYEIEADITSKFRKSGGLDHGWDPIISAGARACTIHQMANNGAIGDKDLIVIDIGAGVDNYCADITRTIAQHQPTKRQRQVYEAVQAVQRYALNLIKPGVIFKDYEAEVEKFMGEKLRELGLIKTIDSENVRKYYPHRTSHFLGLDIHDVGDYGAPLEPNMVITVEPGIYIPEEALGVRIEDDVLITARGNKVLSASLPQKLH